MNSDGRLTVTVYATTGESCTITTLDNYCDTFEKCRIDTFVEGEVQECQGFEVPEHDILIVNVQHFGTDKWGPEYFK